MMKKLLNAFLAAIGCMLLLSCNSNDSEPDIEDEVFDATLVQVMPVSVASTNQMSTTVLLDATLNTEVEPYKDKIKKYEVTRLLFAVENYDSPVQGEIYFNGVLGFGSKSSTTPSASCDIENYNIPHVANTGDAEFSNCTQKVNDVAGLLLNENAAKIYMLGAFTQAPATFDLKITIKVKITAEPL